VNPSSSIADITKLNFDRVSLLGRLCFSSANRPCTTSETRRDSRQKRLTGAELPKSVTHLILGTSETSASASRPISSPWSTTWTCTGHRRPPRPRGSFSRCVPSLSRHHGGYGLPRGRTRVSGDSKCRLEREGTHLEKEPFFSVRMLCLTPSRKFRSPRFRCAFLCLLCTYSYRPTRGAHELQGMKPEWRGREQRHRRGRER
jgi:hypothetical protein